MGIQKIVFSLFLILTLNSLKAQIGGHNSYAFLDMDYNARSVALGGDYLLSFDDDINGAASNPASITKKMDKNLALNHAFFPSGINFGQIAYGRDTQKFGTFVGHMRYVSYGRFEKTDETGQDLGTFTAGDYAFGLGYAHQLNKYFSLGGNFNVLLSHLESYTSFGVSLDGGIIFHDEKTNITSTLLVRSLGTQIKGYTSANRESLPLQILAGISYKFHHAPFRLSLMGHHLNTWDLSYYDPNWSPVKDPISGEFIPVPQAGFVEKLFRHTIFGVEILPNKNLSIRFGYNYNRRKSLGVETRMGIAGFSAGFGIRIKKFNFNYALSSYSVAGTSNMFSITTNLNDWKKNNKY